MHPRVRLFTAVLLGFSSFLAASEPSAPVPDTTVVRAHLAVQSVRLVDNGDNDGFADQNETVSIYVTLRNGSGSDRHGIVVRLGSTDPTVACIPTPIVSFGSLLAGEVREGAVPLVLRVADVARLDPFQDLAISLEFVISGDDFGSATYPQWVTLDVDLNVSGGFLPTSYAEGFENAGFGSFTTQSLDAGRESLAASDGFRCQYNDPDFMNSNSYGNTNCFLGAASPAQNAYDWHVHTTASPDGGRAYLGNNSLHFGVHSGAASADTTRLRQLDAIRTTNPVNLGWNGVSSQLSFKHQIATYEHYGMFDRAVVQVQLANSAGQGIGSWRKISPYENLYDSQAAHHTRNCLFDPTDDGTTEDDYFDPADPNRRLGPSSTCFPEFVFGWQGDILYSHVFDENAIGLASDGPGLQGVRGPGTWVESKFNLHRWRGRRLRVRFLRSSLEIWSGLTWQQTHGWNPIDVDDGWYLDDVRITNTLTSAATVSVDTADRSELPACGPVCGSVTASLVAPPIVQCGQAFTVDASGSTADQCPGGALQFRFWVNVGGGGANEFSEYADMLQDWSENAVISEVIDEPLQWFPPRRFGIDVRCSTLPACRASTTTLVDLDREPIPFPYTIRFDSKFVLSWGTTAEVDAIRGDLHALRTSGGSFNGTVEPCLESDYVEASLSDGVPAPGEAKYYLVRQHYPYCAPRCGADSYSTGSVAEVPAAGGDRDDDIALDPNHCPSPCE